MSPGAPGLDDFPFTPGELEHLRLADRRSARTGPVGAHLTRRLGRSLEFRELVEYMPGDDFRYIDWRASARHGTEAQWLVRTFQSEEAVTVAISVDGRETLRLPEGHERDGSDSWAKIRLAAWLTRAVAEIASRNKDRVFLHHLFAQPARPAREVRSSQPMATLRPFLEELSADPAPPESEPNLGALFRVLPPASVWIVITDLYFPGAARDALERALARARAGMRWVVLVDLDSWPHERALIDEGGWVVDGPGTRDGIEVESSERYLDDQGAAIDAHKAPLISRLSAADYAHWKWPHPEEGDLAGYFRRRFADDEILRDLFRRSG